MYSDRIDELFSSQLQEWELARINYSLLEKVRTRKLDFGTYEISVQFNPERMRSSAAKVDARSIGERPCFLCGKNRPKEQRGLSFENKLTFLVNPFPIFNRHLTIPSDDHIDQRIGNNFSAMLSLSRQFLRLRFFTTDQVVGHQLPIISIFRQGIKDFCHWRKILWMESIQKCSFRDKVWKSGNGKTTCVELSHLKEITGTNLYRVFDRLYEKVSEVQPDGPEPMLNILAGYEQGEWLVHIIPRKLHRPAQFFMHGSDQLLISPAAVDLGGVIITPREEDFNRITRNDIEDIFRQVCFDESELDGILNEIL